MPRKHTLSILFISIFKLFSFFKLELFWNPSTEDIFIYKGTVAQDFWPLVFFINQTHQGPWFMSEIFLNWVSNSQRYSNLKFGKQNIGWRNIMNIQSLYKGKWSLAKCLLLTCCSFKWLVAMKLSERFEAPQHIQQQVLT